MTIDNYVVATHCSNESNAHFIAKRMADNGQSCMIYAPGSDMGEHIETFWGEKKDGEIK